MELKVQHSNNVKKIKTLLAEHSLYDKSRRIANRDGTFFIPVLARSETDRGFLCTLGELTAPARSCDESENSIRQGSPLQKLAERLFPDIGNDLLSSIPKRWSGYGSMLLFPAGSFKGWSEMDLHKFAEAVVSGKLPGFSSVSHVAINNPIPPSDVVRRPHIIPLCGDFDDYWCHAVQNGIHQCWSPVRTMFSRGNITEKARVLTFSNVENQNVVDMYAGIGYFTFSYVAAGAKQVFAWEVNPASVEGLRRGALLNKWSVRVVLPDEDWNGSDERIVVFLESNERAVDRLKHLQLDVAHINLGLLPDSKGSWSASLALSGKHTQIHIHENVSVSELERWMQETKRQLSAMSERPATITENHLEKVKTFAPDVWHVVGDFSVAV